MSVNKQSDVDMALEILGYHINPWVLMIQVPLVLYAAIFFIDELLILMAAILMLESIVRYCSYEYVPHNLFGFRCCMWFISSVVHVLMPNLCMLTSTAPILSKSIDVGTSFSAGLLNHVILAKMIYTRNSFTLDELVDPPNLVEL